MAYYGWADMAHALRVIASYMDFELLWLNCRQNVCELKMIITGSLLQTDNDVNHTIYI